jgi:hypothetical protein
MFNILMNTGKNKMDEIKYSQHNTRNIIILTT